MGTEQTQANGHAAPPADVARDRLLDGLRTLSSLLDNRFKLPFLPGFGLDAMLGVVPVLGDAITGLMGLYALVVAHRRGLPLRSRLAIVWNILVDFGVGAIPLLGDLFDWVFQAHRKNLRIIERHAARQALPAAQPRTG